MIYNWTQLPLYDSWDYEYSIALEGVSYRVRLYYSDRTQTWSVDVSLEEGDALIQGEALLPYKLNIADKIDTLNGFFWLEPISLDDNETFLHPDLLFKYFNLFYITVDLEGQ